MIEGDMTMIERLARVIHKASFEAGRQIAPPWPEDRFEQTRYLFVARAAIKAMREPSDAMFAAAEKHSSFRGIDAGAARMELGAIWREMIDAALSQSGD